MADATNLLWVDTETTGLVVEDEVLLEWAVILTDQDGEIIAGDSWLVEDSTTYYKDCIARARHNNIVGPMHEKSGLWKELEGVEGPDFGSRTPGNVSNYILNFFANNEIESFTLPMCGNNVPFDRAFTAHYLPEVEKMFHYRNIDISTVKELCKRHNPRVFAASPKELQGNDLPHRAYADLLSSIEEYKFYLDNFLWVV